MKSRVLAIEVVLLAFTAGSFHTPVYAQSAVPHYSSSQIRRMVRTARTAQQYGTLADYYEVQRRMYVRKAAEEMHLWADRSEMMTPLSEKWPRPVDSARNLYEYYLYKAARSAALCARYNKLADAAADQP